MQEKLITFFNQEYRWTIMSYFNLMNSFEFLVFLYEIILNSERENLLHIIIILSKLNMIPLFKE